MNAIELWRWFYKLPDAAFRIPTLALLVVLSLMLLALPGCASFGYDWQQTRAPAPKPWHYIVVEDVDRACRAVGAKALEGTRILGCAVWNAQACTIYLPKGAQEWTVRHEERH